MAARKTRRQLQFTGFEMTLIGVSFVVSMTAVFFLGLFVGKKNASYHAPQDDRVARIPVDDFSPYKKPAAPVRRPESAPEPADKAPVPAKPEKTPPPTTARPKPAPKPPVEKKAEEPEPTRGGYTVQLLATRRESDASALVQKLKSRGYAAYVKKVSDGAGSWYRVRVGSYGAFAEARKMADRCRRELGLGQAFVSTE